MSETSTIAALATAPAPAGVAVIRVSGPQTRSVLRAIFKGQRDPVSVPRELVFGSVRDQKHAIELDRALAVFMPKPHSYTGEDVAELQLHGSPLVVERVLRVLFAAGVEPAEPGEFTKRAFLNGKLDLVQAEAVADLISATNEQMLRIAQDHLDGRFSLAVEKLGEPLRDTLAELEAGIDFPEEDISPDSIQALQTAIETAAREVKRLLLSYEYGQAVKEGFRVLLCGRPNAGKSSILNLLLGRKRAIVTEVSGTTRDLIEEAASLSGYRFIFCDSAGLTESQDAVEKIGIELAMERLGWADLVLLVVDATDSEESIQEIIDLLSDKASNIWMVINKIDLAPGAIGTVFCDSKVCRQNFYLSALTGDGRDTLTQALVEEVAGQRSDQAEASSVITNERHRNCLERSRDALARASEAITASLPAEIIAVELRAALHALEELVGKTSVEDILGRIFSKFCIGK